MTSAQVKVVADPAKKSIFHRKVEGKTETLPLKLNAKSQQANLQAQTPNTSVLNQENSTFVFTPANEEFCFNFLWFALGKYLLKKSVLLYRGIQMKPFLKFFAWMLSIWIMVSVDYNAIGCGLIKYCKPFD